MKQSNELLASANNIAIIKALLRSAMFDIVLMADDGHAWQRLNRHIRSYHPIDSASYSAVLISLACPGCCYFPISRWIKNEIRAIRAHGGCVGIPLQDKMFLSFSAITIFVLLALILMTFDISMVRKHI